MAPLRVMLLGETRLELDGRRLSLPAKATALFCYLAVTERSCSRDELLDLLWGESIGGDPAANLRVALSKLRKPLGEFLRSDREQVALQASAPLHLDSREFERFVARSALDRAAEAYRGDFMAAFSLPDAPRFEEWVLTERERLRHLARECHRELSDLKARCGDHSGALDQALRLLALEPWHEEAQRRVMLLRARRGEYEAALQQYESCRSVLQRELQVEPTAATRRLRDRIAAARDRPPPRLPLPHNVIVGRDAQLATLRTLLARPECRLITIVGTGGIGKTRLAVELAHTVQREFLEGVHFVPLAAATHENALVDALVAGLEIDVPAAGDPLLQLTDALAPRETLLVLDEIEQAAGKGADLLVRLLEAAPHLRIVVTSRERLHLSREWLLELEGLDYPAEGVVREPAARTDSELLFVRSAERVGVSREELATESIDIALICRLLAGHPLAIELAAASRERMGSAQIAEAIREGIDALSSGERDVAPRFRTIRAVFDHSWGLLAAHERGVLERLALCAGGFTAAAAERLAGAGPDLLESLVGKSLLRRIEEERFGFHPLVREYALERLRERPEALQLAGRRHAEFYLEHARDALIHRWDDDQAFWSGQLRRELGNVRAALDWSLENDPLFGLGLARRMGQFWRRWGMLREGRRWLEALLAAAPADQEPETRAEALNGLASVAFLQGDGAAAREYYRQSLELRERLDDEEGVAMVLNNLANVLRRDGELEQAEEHYRRSLEVRERLGDDQGVASTLSNLGLTAERRGELAEAHRLYLRSLELRRKVNDLEGVAIALCNLGFVTYKRGEYLEARDWFRKSLEQEWESGGRSLLDDSFTGLAAVEAAQGQPVRAARLLGAADALRESSGKALAPAEAEEVEATLEQLRCRLPATELEGLLLEGGELPLELALRLALEDPS